MFSVRLLDAMARYGVAAANLGATNAATVLLRRMQPSKAVTRLSTAKFGPVHFRSAGDYGVLTHLFEPQVRMRNVPVERVRTIFDIGANIGIETLRFHRLYPSALLVSVEADSSNFEVLQKNVSCLRNAHIHNRGLWNSNARLKVFNENGSNEAFRVRETDSDDFDFQGITIPELIERHNVEEIDILKIDIEGSEKVVFDSTCDRWLHRVNCIVMECPDNDERGTVQLIFDAFRRNDLTVNTFIHGENLVFVKQSLPWTPESVRFY